MKFRTTLIAALLLAGFGAYVYYFEYKKVEEEKKQEEEAKKVFSIDWEKLKGLQITNSHGTFRLEKRKKEAEEGEQAGAAKTDWRIVEPLQTDGDDITLNSMVGSLKNVKVEQVVAEPAENLEPYGLKEPKIRIQVLPGEGDEVPPPLLVGEKSPVGYNSYAMREGENKVLLLSTHLAPQFDKKLYDLRHKKLFAFKREDVERIRIRRSGDPEVELARKGDRWELVKPIRARASESEVDQILNKLTTLKAQAFESEAPEDLADYGLDKPVWEVEVTLKPDQTRATLLLGSMHIEEGKHYIYGKRGERPEVVSLGMDLIGAFSKQPEELREKRVMPFKTWKVRKVELQGKDLEMTLHKREGSKWWIESPIEARADGTKMTAFLGALNRLEGEDFLEKPRDEEGMARYGLDEPLARVALYEEKPAGEEAGGEGGEEGEQEAAEKKKEDYPLLGVVLLGKGRLEAGEADEEEAAYYAFVEGEDTVYRVKKDFYEESFPKDLDALRSKKVVDFSRYIVTEIHAKRPEGPVVLKRKGATWKIKEPGSGTAEEKAVNGLLTEVLDLKVERFIEPTPGDLASIGLDPPAREISFRKEDGEVLGTVLFSDRGPEGEVDSIYVKQKEEPWVGVIRKADQEAVLDKLEACLSEG